MVIRTTLLLIAVLLSGCAGHRAAPVATAADDVPLGALPRQTLDKGQCGLFLWRAGAGARLVLVVRSGAHPVARLMLAGGPLDLPRLPDDGSARSDGTARYGDGRVILSLDLTIERREGLSDGAVAGGSIWVDVVGAEGFVTPVSGLLACN